MRDAEPWTDVPAGPPVFVPVPGAPDGLNEWLETNAAGRDKCHRDAHVDLAAARAEAAGLRAALAALPQHRTFIPGYGTRYFVYLADLHAALGTPPEVAPGGEQRDRGQRRWALVREAATHEFCWCGEIPGHTGWLTCIEKRLETP